MVTGPVFGGANVPAQVALVLPYLRSSPVHIPRRDLVVSRSDSLVLLVTVVESDDPAALTLTLTGGIGGPTLRLVVRSDHSAVHGWDYGYVLAPGLLIATIDATISATPGSFDIFLSPSAMARWPLRCRWQIQLDSPEQSVMLAAGYLHVAGGDGVIFGEVPLLTDDGDLVLEDDGVTGVDAA